MRIKISTGLRSKINDMLLTVSMWWDDFTYWLSCLIEGTDFALCEWWRARKKERAERG